MIKAGIIGATGYAGSELVRILMNHKDVKFSYLASHSYAGKSFSDIYPYFKGRVDYVLEEDDLEKAAEKSDVVFLALPHGLASKAVTADVLAKCIVIDLGADFRLHDKEVYEEWYKVEHHGEALLEEAVYGLPELHRSLIRNARLIANPGCYTTCSILTMYPLLKNHLVDPGTIIIDAKSGTSGAGRSEKTANLFCEVNESIKAYGVASHRHTPEIEQELSIAYGKDIRLDFTPHLIPMQRGILATCYAKLAAGVSEAEIREAYHGAYDDEPFVRLVDYLPETRFVKGSNYADISFRINSRTGSIIAIGAIDNLVKGAAGQAVENMNIVFGLDEMSGLEGCAGL